MGIKSINLYVILSCICFHALSKRIIRSLFSSLSLSSLPFPLSRSRIFISLLSLIRFSSLLAIQISCNQSISNWIPLENPCDFFYSQVISPYLSTISVLHSLSLPRFISMIANVVNLLFPISPSLPFSLSFLFSFSLRVRSLIEQPYGLFPMWIDTNWH